MRNERSACGVRLQNWLLRMRRMCTREGLRDLAKRWARFLLNPRLLLCLAIAWMITNGWSYVMFALGMLMKIHWMRVVGGAYMSFLWLPFTPEKLVTVVLAIGLMRLLYPRDRRTLGVLRRKLKQISRRPEC